MARKASSGVRIEGIADMIAGLTYTKTEAAGAAAQALQVGAGMLKQRAHDYAPLDEGDLENSIKVLEKNLGKGAAARGALSIEVGVDESVQKKSRQDVTVGQYAAFMELDKYDLGQKSEFKDEDTRAFYAKDGGHVGSGFFGRAIQDGEPYIRRVMDSKIAAALRKANSRTSAVSSKRKTK